MVKTTVYVSVATMSYSFTPHLASSQFILKLEPHEARVFGKLFQQINSLEAPTAFRAHLPYIPYHLDQVNDEHDLRLKKVYALIHSFGDEKTKQFVEQLPYFS